jgi:hypothetical protein
MRGAAYNTAKAFQDALEKAERQITTAGRPTGADATVEVLPSAIEIRPELFQPGEFSFGLRGTDKDHVKKLARFIGIQGELDPIVVIKLGKKFVCVDGHHRLEAYKKENWTSPIKCEWFGGSVREAADQSITRNAKDRLNVPQADRLEQAWKRVLLGWWSKAEIVRLCGVGDGTVAQMRRVMEHWRKRDALGNEFRRNLGGGNLYETSWAQAKLAWLGVGASEIDDELQAVRLAKRLRARLTNILSRNPAVTARALTLYDSELPKGIAEAWGVPSAVSVVADDEDESDGNAAASLSGSDKALQREAETHRQRISAIEAELARRASGGAPSDHAWDEWTRTDQA